MSLCLLNILKEWIGILFVLLSSLFSNDVATEKIEVAYNLENVNIETTVKAIEYKTQRIYNSKISSGTINTLTEGEVGIIYNVDGEEIVLREPIDEVIEIGTGPKASYTGSITGYGADCVGCSGKVSCKTPEGVYYDLANNGEYYNDSEYGNLRIIAADHLVFKCGTVVDITSTNGTKINAIVLDTGIAMRRAWRNNGKILVDVAFVTENDPGLFDVTDKSGNVRFDVKRWGW